jgi:transposase-like protein
MLGYKCQVETELIRLFNWDSDTIEEWFESFKSDITQRWSKIQQADTISIQIDYFIIKAKHVKQSTKRKK